MGCAVACRAMCTLLYAPKESEARKRWRACVGGAVRPHAVAQRVCASARPSVLPLGGGSSAYTSHSHDLRGGVHWAREVGSATIHYSGGLTARVLSGLCKLSCPGCDSLRFIDHHTRFRAVQFISTVAYPNRLAQIMFWKCRRAAIDRA